MFTDFLGACYDKIDPYCKFFEIDPCIKVKG